jgi:hypothetical protein
VEDRSHYGQPTNPGPATQRRVLAHRDTTARSRPGFRASRHRPNSRVRHPYCDTVTCSISHLVSDTKCDTNAYSSPNRHTHPNSHCHAHSFLYTYGDCYEYRHTYAHIHTNGNPDPHAHAHTTLADAGRHTTYHSGSDSHVSPH